MLTFALGCALAAAVLAIVADDPRLLRAAVVAALVAAFVPTLLPTLEQRPSPRVDADVRRLRLEVATLRGELNALCAAGPLVVPERTTTWELPLMRATVRTPTASTNGHAATIDLTEAAKADAS